MARTETAWVLVLLAATVVGCTERSDNVTPTVPTGGGGGPVGPPPANTSPVAGFTKLTTLASLAAGSNPRGAAIAPTGFPTGSTLVAGEVLVAAPSLNRIIRIDTSGATSTFADEATLQDSASGSLANLGYLVSPQDVSIDSGGRVWVATAAGTNGNGGTGNLVVLDANGRVILQGTTPAVLQASAFNTPVSVAWNGGVAATQACFVANGGTGALHRVAINATALASSTVTVIATGFTAPGLQFLAHDIGADNLFATVAAAGVNELRLVASASTVAGGDNDVLLAVAAGTLNAPAGVAVNDTGNAVVVNRGAGTLVEITPLAGVAAALTTPYPVGALQGLAVGIGVARFVVTDTTADAVRELLVPSFANDLQPIFNGRCSGFSCHVGGGSSGGLQLDSSGSYNNLVGATSSQVNPDVRVKAGNPGTGTGGSYLIEKLTLAIPRVGGRMPTSGGFLSQSQIDLLVGWIWYGAPNN